MKNREMEISAFLVLLLFALIAFAKDKPAEVKGGNGIILPPPPATEAKPVTENIHGTTLTDPYPLNHLPVCRLRVCCRHGSSPTVVLGYHRIENSNGPSYFQYSAGTDTR